MRLLGPIMLVALVSCAPVDATQTERLAATPVDLPPMKVFSTPRPRNAERSNAEIARDFIDLTFQLESGRPVDTFTRFEEPVSLRVVGGGPETFSRDVNRLLARLRSEAGIDVTRVDEPGEPAAVTIEFVPRQTMRRAVPQAACFVVPRMSSWEEFRDNRRSSDLDWTTLSRREHVAIFIPSDVSPQEMRDCLHEELAQALGPLNDLYRLTDSVFNDDNFHTVLTGFDMLLLRVTYAPELRSGMTRAEVASRLPAILSRINPAGRSGADRVRSGEPRAWTDAVETALGPRAAPRQRVDAAREAVAIARREGWRDNRTAFSLFALGRLSLPVNPELAFSSFVEAAQIYRSDPTARLQSAHVAMQLAAFALSAGDGEAVLRIIEPHLEVVEDAENAALLASLLMMKAEALEIVDREAEARRVRAESLGWARYGFGTEDVVRARIAEISELTPTGREGV